MEIFIIMSNRPKKFPTEHEDMIAAVLQSSIQLAEDYNGMIKNLKKQGQPVTKLNHDTLRLIQRWFNYSGGL